MILKYVLNSILLIIAISFIAMCIFKTTELSSRSCSHKLFVCHLIKEDIKICACLHCIDSYGDFLLPKHLNPHICHLRQQQNSRSKKVFISSLRLYFVYCLSSLSASFLSCSACSLSNLARSNASVCFLLRYSKSITESVRI